MKRLSFAAFLVCFTTVAGPALADDRPTVSAVQTSDYLDHNVAGDRIITFSTDGLDAGGTSMYGFTLRRPPGVIRLGLIRPRVNFVAELLKSVENL